MKNVTRAWNQSVVKLRRYMLGVRRESCQNALAQEDEGRDQGSWTPIKRMQGKGISSQY